MKQIYNNAFLKMNKVPKNTKNYVMQHVIIRYVYFTTRVVILNLIQDPPAQRHKKKEADLQVRSLSKVC